MAFKFFLTLFDRIFTFLFPFSLGFSKLRACNDKSEDVCKQTLQVSFHTVLDEAGVNTQVGGVLVLNLNKAQRLLKLK